MLLEMIICVTFAICALVLWGIALQLRDMEYSPDWCKLCLFLGSMLFAVEEVWLTAMLVENAEGFFGSIYVETVLVVTIVNLTITYQMAKMFRKQGEKMFILIFSLLPIIAGYILGCIW